MNLPIRARLTLLYCAVLGLTFVAFFWICDLGFRHSIETTVNDSSRTNLDTVRRLLANTASQGDESVRAELRDLSNLWANGALLEVADAKSTWLFRSPQFLRASPSLPQLAASDIAFFTTNLDSSQYRVALGLVEVRGARFEIHAAVPTEPFDQALDRFRPTSICFVTNPTQDECDILAKSTTVGVFSTGKEVFEGPGGDAVKNLADAGGAIALSSGYDSNSAATFSMQMSIALAVVRLGLTPEAALTAATINAAHAAGCAHLTGSLEHGKQGDILLMNVPDYRELPRQFGNGEPDFPEGF